MLIGLVFWGAVIYGVVYLITHLARSKSDETKASAKGEDFSLEILRRRYAAGEIDAEEFAKRKKDLEA